MFSDSDMQEMAGVSRFLCNTMDRIGYSREIIESRRYFWDEVQMNMQNTSQTGNFHTHCKYAGSKAEGITAFFESDIDMMKINDTVICTSNVEPFLQLPDMTIFQTDMSNTSPGYTKLKLINSGAHHDTVLDNALFRENSREIFASSVLLTSEYLRHSGFMHIHHISGPAISNSVHDYVFALHCISPNVLQSFVTRRRQHDWPPSHIIQDSCSDVCQLVPVGYKGSSEQWKEWRFCFVETELRLTRSLNNTQLKLYIVLKMIAKDILKSVSKDISSYIMKNITYWMSEQFGSSVFREENLMTLILIALMVLKNSVDNYYLPYFMIPGRNLLAERLEPSVRRNLSDVISQLLDEGPRLLLRCTKLREGMLVLYRSPRRLDDNKREKEAAELLVMIASLHVLHRMSFIDIKRIAESMSPSQFRDFIQFSERAKQFLSSLLV